MPLRKEMSRQAKYQDKRRGVRVNSRVPVVLEWEAEAGQTVHEQALTRIVGPYGCLVVTPQSLDLEQRLRVTNLATCQSTPAVVVWKGSERAEGWELGLELLNPQMDFWGLEL